VTTFWWPSLLYFYYVFILFFFSPLFLTNKIRENESCHQSCLKWLFKYQYSMKKTETLGLSKTCKYNQRCIPPPDTHTFKETHSKVVIDKDQCAISKCNLTSNHLDSLLKINEHDMNAIYFQQINRGIRRILIDVYFYATKTGNLLCCKQIKITIIILQHFCFILLFKNK